MEAVDLQEVTESKASSVVTLGSLAELTGFPVDYIKRELFLENELDLEELSLEDLKKKVLAYLETF